MLASVSYLLTASFLASTALAHFTLDYPTSRGFDEDIEPQFCGGFNNVLTPRQAFPLGKGPVWIDSHHTLATVSAFLSVSTAPTSFNDFNTTSNGTEIPPVTNFFQVTQGEFCWNINLGALAVGLTNGSQVTLQVLFDGPDGNLYQCTDLVLIDEYQVPTNETCTNDVAATFHATATGLASVTQSSTASGTAASTTSGTPTSSASGTASASAAAKSSAASAGYAKKQVTGMGSVVILGAVIFAAVF